MIWTNEQFEDLTKVRRFLTDASKVIDNSQPYRQRAEDVANKVEAILLPVQHLLRFIIQEGSNEEQLRTVREVTPQERAALKRFVAQGNNLN